VQNTKEMYKYVQSNIDLAKKGKMTSSQFENNNEMELIQKKPYFFSVAAVSDYVPKTTQSGKIKKASIGDKWNLELEKNIDILDSVEKKGIYTVGFKAEMDNNTAKENASNMLKTKNIDAVCLNLINNENNFGSNTNEIELITKISTTPLEKDTKLNISFKILEQLKEQFSE